MLEPFPKINSIYKRDQRGRFLDGEWATDEIAYLKDLPWRWTEKVDGTNIRLGYNGRPANGTELSFIAGRTDNAQIPPKLLQRLVELMRTLPFGEVFPDADDVTLYGEGYGAGIQKGGGNYISTHCDFVLFEVKVGNWWLKRDAIEDVATKLDVPVVPLVMTGTIADAIDMVRANAFKSDWPNVTVPDGLVGVPVVDLFDRRGDRIMTKVKHRDFQ